MPSGVISHQAPGLFLKVKYPRKFDGTALCLSTIIPDISVILDPFSLFNFRNITHSLLGLVVLTIPLTIVLTMFFSSYLGPFLANLAKRNGSFWSPMKYFGVDEWDNLKKKKYNKRYFIVAAYSALIGGLTHLLLDLPSHEYVELFFPMVYQNPDFLLYSIIDFGSITIGSMQFDRNLTIYQLIWSIETLVGFVIALYLLRYIKNHNLISKWYKEIGS
jgi:membrane-bound metal-dependent hydrolase YbcI (DUF457 family)